MRKEILAKYYERVKNVIKTHKIVMEHRRNIIVVNLTESESEEDVDVDEDDVEEEQSMKKVS